ncbi:MAG: hypothetical protein ACO363_07325 [Balneolaceae bacterium]
MSSKISENSSSDLEDIKAKSFDEVISGEMPAPESVMVIAR